MILTFKEEHGEFNEERAVFSHYIITFITEILEQLVSYVYDDKVQKYLQIFFAREFACGWRPEGGGLNSFLENFLGISVVFIT